MNIKRNSRYKSRGSILVITALAAIVWIFIAQSLFIVGTGGFGMIKSSRVALQAQQYAEIEVDRLKNVAYENLDSDGAHSRQAIANIQESGWEDEVSIGSEHSISGSDNAKQRIATVNVYKSGDTLPRFTLEVPLSSQSSSTGGGKMPDYSKAIDIKGKCPFTAPSDGYVLFAGSFDWAAGVNGTGVVVNDKYIVAAAGHGGSNGTGRGASLSAVSKGDIINTFLTGYSLSISSLGSFTSGLLQLYFIPAKKNNLAE